MRDLGSWSDNHLEPDDDPIVGEDWNGNNLYGHEYGYKTPHGFVIEDEAIEYLDAQYGLGMSVNSF